MYQADRGGYRKKESLFSMFWHSCLGKTVFMGLIFLLLLVLALVMNPSEKYMREEMYDNIRQCIERPDSVQTDKIDDALSNIGYIFTKADGKVNKELWTNFTTNNRLEYFNHTFFSTMHVFNNFRLDGIRCAIGVFGIVIPTINFNDLLLRDGPLREDYEDRPVQIEAEDLYFGETPDLIFKEENYY